MILAQFDDFSPPYGDRSRPGSINHSINAGNHKRTLSPSPTVTIVKKHKTNPTKDGVTQIIKELMIQNLDSTYFKTHPRDYRKEKELRDAQNRQKDQVIIERLYKGQGIGGTKSRLREQQNSQQENVDNQHPFYSEIHDFEPNYKENYAHKQILKSIKETEQKLKQVFILVSQEKKKNKSKAKKSEQSTELSDQDQKKFKKVLILFLNQLSVESIKKMTEKKQCYPNETMLSTEFEKFIRKINFNAQRNLNSKEINIKDIFKKAELIPFYGILFRSGNYKGLKRDELANFIEQSQNSKDLVVFCLKWINQEVDSNQNHQKLLQYVFSLYESKIIQNSYITVPYETVLYEPHKQPVFRVPQQEQEIFNYQPPKAKPVPISTYKCDEMIPRRDSEQEKHKNTVPVPFSFYKAPSSQARGNTKTLNEYYTWDRNFKANPIPKSTYQVQDLTKNVPKQATKDLLKSAQYPSRMKDQLQHYTELKNEKIHELDEKYNSKRYGPGARKSVVKEVPNFKKIHHHQMMQMEESKQRNKFASTQPKPFNFASNNSKGRQAKLTQAQLYSMNSNLHKQATGKPKSIGISSTVPEAKSTLKFDAYVQARRKGKEQQTQNRKQREQHYKRRQQNMKVYKDMLKQRMHDSLSANAHGSKANYISPYCPPQQNTVKVDLESIYRERPLLMDSVEGTSKLELTYFTDTYDPII